ncbi:MAG: hypothetical protein J5379_01095 [Clostridiales bacterium]|nr:hypothetical protein [Clostridiales bacterium]
MIRENAKKTMKKTGAMILAAVMSAALVPHIAGAPKVAAAWSKNKDNTALRTSKMADPDQNVGFGEWSGSYVYYGKYNNEPIKFRVLDSYTAEYGGRKMILDCDTVLFKACYDDDPQKTVTWDTSVIKTQLNGDMFLDKPGVFTDREKTAIGKNKISSHELVAGNGMGKVSDHIKNIFAHSTEITGEKIFLLDVEEVSNCLYGYNKNHNNVKNRVKKDADGYACRWWLRSESVSYHNFLGAVGSDGMIGLGSSTEEPIGVAPAMNINLAYVLFSTLISGTRGQVGAEYKLTIKDDDLSISVPEGKQIDVSGNTVTVPYEITGSNAGSANCVSVLILDEIMHSEYSYASKILFYDSLKGSFSTNGTGTFTLPGNLSGTWGKDYHVFILAEDVNGTYETDYASELFEIKPLTEVVIDLSSGTATQDEDLLTAMMQLGNRALVYREPTSGDDAMNIDIDRNGTWDIRCPFEYGAEITRLDTCSVFGTYTFSYDQVVMICYSSITFKLPLCKASITKAEPTDNGIQVRWGSVAGFTSYNVYRSSSQSGTYSYLGSVTGGTTRYTDKTAQGGKTYYYKVRPYFKADGKTIYAAWSDAKKVTVLADTKLTAEPKNGVTMKLSWTAVSGADSYEIYRATSAGGPYTYVKATTGTSTSDTGLTAGTRYYYMVRAKRTVNGQVQYSKYNAAVAVALATPSMESATFKSGKGVTLTWTKASGADRYNVYKYNTSTGKYDYVTSVLGGTLTYTDASGKKGDYYKVRAYKRVDGVVYYGGWSNAKMGK